MCPYMCLYVSVYMCFYVSLYSDNVTTLVQGDSSEDKAAINTLQGGYVYTFTNACVCARVFMT
jgi:hypothetical protein